MHWMRPSMAYVCGFRVAERRERVADQGGLRIPEAFDECFVHQRREPTGRTLRRQGGTDPDQEPEPKATGATSCSGVGLTGATAPIRPTPELQVGMGQEPEPKATTLGALTHRRHASTLRRHAHRGSGRRRDRAEHGLPPGRPQRRPGDPGREGTDRRRLQLSGRRHHHRADGHGDGRPHPQGQFGAVPPVQPRGGRLHLPRRRHPQPGGRPGRGPGGDAAALRPAGSPLRGAGRGRDAPALAADGGPGRRLGSVRPDRGLQRAGRVRGRHGRPPAQAGSRDPGIRAGAGVPAAGRPRDRSAHHGRDDRR